MKLALYKGTRPGLAGVYNRLVRWWTASPYSHCELVFSDGMCASSSWMDGGVRLKRIEFDPAKWDVIAIEGDEAAALSWFFDHDMDGYDLLGMFWFVFGGLRQDRRKWTCSEACGAALQIKDPWRFDPCQLGILVQQRGVK